MKEDDSGHGGKKIKIGTQMEERVFRRSLPGWSGRLKFPGW